MSLASRDSRFNHLVAVTDLAWAAFQTANRCAGQLAVRPGYIPLEPAAGAQAFDAAAGPTRWEGGQQLDFPRLALQQHLGHTGGHAEIAVQLHRRMQAEK